MREAHCCPVGHPVVPTFGSSNKKRYDNQLKAAAIVSVYGTDAGALLPKVGKLGEREKLQT